VFMNLNPFKKKKAEEPPPMEGQLGPPPAAGPPSQAGPPDAPPAGKIIPTDEVRALSSRGVPEPDIIRTLRREGYSTGEIDQAMKEALRSKVSGEFYQSSNEYGERPLGGPPEKMPPSEEIPGGLGYPISGGPEVPPPPAEEPPPQEPAFPEAPTGDDFLKPPPVRSDPDEPRRRGPSKGIDRKDIEELAEVIVEEKLRIMDNRFKTIDAQIQQVNKRVDTFSGELDKIRSEKGGVVEGIESKIDAYSKQIDEVNGKIESMEKAFKDSLTPMLESMRSLAELVKGMKEKKE
jgi:hypothetical protein